MTRLRSRRGMRTAKAGKDSIANGVRMDDEAAKQARNAHGEAGKGSIANGVRFSYLFLSESK